MYAYICLVQPGTHVAYSKVLVTPAYKTYAQEVMCEFVLYTGKFSQKIFANFTNVWKL